MTNLPDNFNFQQNKKEILNLWAYIDSKKRKVGYAYLTKNGNLCIRGDKMLDKAQLGRLLVKGLYVTPPQSQL